MPNRKPAAAPNRNEPGSAAAETRAAKGALSDRDFAAGLAAFAPFERAPRLAVAVSGGPDSLALCVLAQRWARAHGGRVTALTVDHGLRRESAKEARWVGRLVAPLGITHVILRWRGRKPARGVAAAARAARYRLLEDWCQANGVLHLLLGHQREDQAETVIMRAGAGSGLDGLAGMAALVERPHVRLLRPLLAVSTDRLRATLEALHLEWVEDPSNRDLRFTRARVRRARPDTVRWSGWAGRLARIRASEERVTAALLAASVTPDPAGFCRVDRAALRAQPRPFAVRALGRVLLCVGGESYPPRRESLERLAGRLLAERPAGPLTLARCRAIVRGDTILIVRERRGTAAGPNRAARWDDRFDIDAPKAAWLRVAPLGTEGWQARRPDVDERHIRPPPLAMAMVPAFYRGARLVAVPALGRPWLATARIRVNAGFAPAQSLVPPPFAVA